MSTYMSMCMFSTWVGNSSAGMGSSILPPMSIDRGTDQFFFLLAPKDLPKRALLSAASLMKKDGCSSKLEATPPFWLTELLTGLATASPSWVEEAAVLLPLQLLPCAKPCAGLLYL